MKRMIKYGMLACITAISVLGAVYLPEYIINHSDRDYMNRVQVYVQEAYEPVNMSLNLQERIQIWITCINTKENSVCLLETEDMEQVLESDKDFMTNMKHQLSLLEQKYVIPKISEDIIKTNTFQYANLYALTSDECPGKVLYVWCLNFTNRENENICSITVDAKSYHIYEVNISGESVITYADQIYEIMYRDYEVRDALFMDLTNAYVEYLGRAMNNTGENGDVDNEVLGTISILENKFETKVRTNDTNWLLRWWFDADFASFNFSMEDALNYKEDYDTGFNSLIN